MGVIHIKDKISHRRKVHRQVSDIVKCVDLMIGLRGYWVWRAREVTRS